MCGLVQDSTPPSDLGNINCKRGWLTAGGKGFEKATEAEPGTKCRFVLVFQWDLVCEQRGLNQATATFFFIGVTMGAVVFGYLSDRSDPCQAVPPGLQFRNGNFTNPWPAKGNRRGERKEKTQS